MITKKERKRIGREEPVRSVTIICHSQSAGIICNRIRVTVSPMGVRSGRLPITVSHSSDPPYLPIATPVTVVIEYVAGNAITWDVESFFDEDLGRFDQARRIGKEGTVIADDFQFDKVGHARGAGMGDALWHCLERFSVIANDQQAAAFPECGLLTSSPA